MAPVAQEKDMLTFKRTPLDSASQRMETAFQVHSLSVSNSLSTIYGCHVKHVFSRNTPRRIRISPIGDAAQPIYRNTPEMSHGESAP
jgi:hypothetical protein